MSVTTDSTVLDSIGLTPLMVGLGRTVGADCCDDDSALGSLCLDESAGACVLFGGAVAGCASCLF